MKPATTSLIDELSWRGLLQDSTDVAELRQHLDEKPRHFYVGFDPSAPSLTIGNLLAMSLVIHGARAGHKGIVLLGGGTGLIGDPSGKTVERTLLSKEGARDNVARHQKMMSAIYERVLGPDHMPEFVDNAEWLVGMEALDFLRDVGKHFPIPDLLRRDSVRRRLGDPEAGLSYTEFSYPLLQAYDFMRLHADRNVTLQMGASDQWGNIVAGIDYVRRVLGEQVYGLTCPLLLRSDGTKFGKTEKGAVWISADRTSPYTLYQFLINLSDDEARHFALFFSLEDRAAIEAMFARHADKPSSRVIQRHVAREITALLHGEQAASRAVQASEALFAGDVHTIDADMLGEMSDVPAVDLPLNLLDDAGMSATDLLIAVELASSKRDAREHVGNAAVQVNGHKADSTTMVTRDDLLHGSVIFVRRGKREWRLARFE